MKHQTQELKQSPLTRDAFNKDNNITVHNCRIKPIQNGEQLKPFFHYSINTIMSRLEIPFNKYFSYMVQAINQQKDLIIIANQDSDRVLHLCVLNKVLRDRTRVGNHKVIYVTQQPHSVFYALGELNPCGVKINYYIKNAHENPEIDIKTPFEFLSMHPKKDTLVIVTDYNDLIRSSFKELLKKDTPVIIIREKLLSTSEYQQLREIRPFTHVDYITKRSITTTQLSVNIELCYFDSFDAKADKLISECGHWRNVGTFVETYRGAESLYCRLAYPGRWLMLVNVKKCKRNNLEPSLQKARAQHAMIISTKFNILKRMKTVYFFNPPRLKSFVKFVNEIARSKPKRIVVMLATGERGKNESYKEFVKTWAGHK